GNSGGRTVHSPHRARGRPSSARGANRPRTAACGVRPRGLRCSTRTDSPRHPSLRSSNTGRTWSSVHPERVRNAPHDLARRAGERRMPAVVRLQVRHLLTEQVETADADVEALPAEVAVLEVRVDEQRVALLAED